VTPRDLESARQHLRTLRLGILEATRRAAAEHAALTGAERGHELEEEAQAEQGLADLERLGEAEQRELGRIDAALLRIDQGGYGACVECGTAIEPKRLVALPWAILCTGCAEAREQAAAHR
jgi:DnaK suppressor protein